MSDAETGDVETRIARLEQQDQRLSRALERLAEREAAPSDRCPIKPSEQFEQ